uniref:Integrase catalytic domain-containing protein n=1 Tax=Salarias fasciatus TaxID=181472 RepID=A0A672IQ52_SALFA
MWTDVWGHVRTCTTCQQDKGLTEKPAGLLQSPDVKTPGEVIGVDFLGLFPPSRDQNSILMVVVDHYSQWVELFAMRDAEMPKVWKILRDKIFTRWGVPRYLVTDRGPQFMSHLMVRMCESWGVTQKLTTAYHPQTNMTEGVDHTLKTVMASFVRDYHQDWDKRLPELRLALNTVVHESTGATPAMLALGRELKGLLERHVGRTPEEVRRHVGAAKARQARYNSARRRDVHFAVGSLGRVGPHPLSKTPVKFSANFAPRWTGPAMVEKRLNPVNYQVRGVTAKGKGDTVSVVDLKPYFRLDKQKKKQNKTKKKKTKNKKKLNN